MQKRVIAVATVASRRLGPGLAAGLLSALMFGVSGPFAKSLFAIGWSPAAAVLVRVGGGALILFVITLFVVRRPWRIVRAHWGQIALYGLIAVVGAQVFYFNAVQTLSVGVALLIEYTAPVLIVFWLWARTRQRPAWIVLAGSGVALAGLALVLDLSDIGSLDPVGLAWAATAALALMGYFLMTERLSEGVPPVLLAGGGMAVGGLVLLLLGLLGVMPLEFGTGSVYLSGHDVSWVVPVLALVVVSSAMPYLVGIRAVLMLGSKLASFVALTEVLFAVLAAWVLVGQVPSPMQAVGGALVLLGVVLVRMDHPAEGMFVEPMPTGPVRIIPPNPDANPDANAHMGSNTNTRPSEGAHHAGGRPDGASRAAEERTER